VPVRAPAVALLALVGGLVACGPDDGRRLADPDPELTAVPVPTTTRTPVLSGDVPEQGVGPGDLTLSSKNFSPGATLPPRSACAGDVSPQLSWTEPPRRAEELALVVQDIDADGVAQWIVTGIPTDVLRNRRGAPPEGSDVRINSAGVEGWTSPCPASGPAHRIVFTLYVLDEELAAGPGDPTSVVTAVQQASMGSASLLARAGLG
jgi:phosphatidylethanolamine-binding protein (PEBP) family uncharacterized protein